ncbi:MAG: DMT family transporter [Nitrospirae bacterium]|nr:DMT family transporter [Nitrospirota bacterium]
MASFYIVLAILIWSSLGVFVRLAGVDVHIILFYSTFFSLFFQSLIFLKKRHRQSIPPLRVFPFIFVLSICLLLNTFTFLFAYSKTSIANAVLTHYTAPVIVAFLAAIFLGEKINLKIIISIVIATTGLWIMLGGSTIVECFRSVLSEGIHLSDDLIGISSGLLSGLFYAILIILIRVFSQRLNPYVVVFFQNLFMTILLLPFVNIIPYDRLWIFIFMGLLHSTVAPYLYYYGLSKVQASRTAILGYLEPVGAIIFGILFLSETPPVRAYLGGALVLISGYLTMRED